MRFNDERGQVNPRVRHRISGTIPRRMLRPIRGSVELARKTVADLLKGLSRRARRPDSPTIRMPESRKRRS